MEHICERCGYKTNLKGNLVKHLKCKNPCSTQHSDRDRSILLEAIIPKKNEENCRHCEWCDKLISKTNMGKHRKVCKNNPHAEMADLNIEENNHNDIEENKESEEIAIMREEIRQLRQEIQSIKQNIASPSNVSIANVQNMNIVNFQLNNFGNESVDHITNEFIGACINGNVNGMKKLIEKIHFSEEAPANKNIRMKSRKDKLVEVQKNNKWEVRDAKDATECMIKKGVQIVSEYYHGDINGIRDYDDNVLHNKIQAFLTDLLGKKTNQYYDLRKRIYALIVEYT